MENIPSQYRNKILDEEIDGAIMYNMDDALMEFVGDYVSNGSGNEKGIKLKPAWQSEYTDKNIPNWNVFYFHFKSVNKCVLYIQINHSIADGIILSKIIEKMYWKMSGDSNIKLINPVVTKKSKRKS